jgi:hypothetical protein
MNEIEQAMPWNEVPDSWLDRCSGNGHTTYVDENGNRRYKDNNRRIEDFGYRPCAKCGHFPINDGEDYCLQHLGNVINACCGHGKHEGYIQFDNGVTIRGHFKIEHCGKRLEVEP